MSTRGVVNDALVLEATIASAFVARWCAAQRIEIIDGVRAEIPETAAETVELGFHHLAVSMMRWSGYGGSHAAAMTSIAPGSARDGQKNISATRWRQSRSAST